MEFSWLRLCKTSEPNWCFIFCVKLHIPALKTLYDFDVYGNLCVSNTTSCANLSMRAPGLHMRETCQFDGNGEKNDVWKNGNPLPLNLWLLWCLFSTVSIKTFSIYHFNKTYFKSLMNLNSGNVVIHKWSQFALVFT